MFSIYPICYSKDRQCYYELFQLKGNVDCKLIKRKGNTRKTPNKRFRHLNCIGIKKRDNNIYYVYIAPHNLKD